MKRNDVYVDLDGNEVSLANLDPEERRLTAQLRRRAASKPDWIDFDNFAFNAVTGLVQHRRDSAKKSQTEHSLSNRSGFKRPPRDWPGDDSIPRLS
jgi:hypothetical protein